MVRKIWHKTRPRDGATALSTRVGVMLMALTGFMIPPTTAYAQNSDTSSGTTASPGLALNMSPGGSGYVGLSPSLSGALIDLPADSVGSALFNLDISDTACVTGETSCLSRNDTTINASYYKPIKSFNVKGLDLQLQSKASMRFNDESSSALVGAVVRLGEDLREGSDLDANTWYVFAGADAEAVTYTPNSVRRMTSGQFYLQDRIIVGDAQAGLGYRIGDADVSIGYFRREVSSFGNNDPSDDFSKTEDAAALSFTWRR